MMALSGVRSSWRDGVEAERVEADADEEAEDEGGGEQALVVEAEREEVGDVAGAGGGDREGELVGEYDPLAQAVRHTGRDPERAELAEKCPVALQIVLVAADSRISAGSCPGTAPAPVAR
jgi:hypothetical protein